MDSKPSTFCGQAIEDRLRTTIRERLPVVLADLIPQGPDDCGDHEWYKGRGAGLALLPLQTGITHTVPWDARELEARRYELGAMKIRAGIERSERRPVTHH